MILRTLIVRPALSVVLEHDFLPHSLRIAARSVSIFFSYEVTGGEGLVSSVHVAANSTCGIARRQRQTMVINIFFIEIMMVDILTLRVDNWQ